MDDWLHTKQRWVLVSLASAERGQAVLPIHTTRNGDVKIPVYENRVQAKAAAESCEEDVVAVPAVPASPPSDT